MAKREQEVKLHRHKQSMSSLWMKFVVTVSKQGKHDYRWQSCSDQDVQTLRLGKRLKSY